MMRHGKPFLLVPIVCCTIVLSCSGTCALVRNTENAYLMAGVVAVVGLLLLVAYRDLSRQDRRRSAGRCLVCGYDLRASPDRCPECGTRVAARVPRT